MMNELKHNERIQCNCSQDYKRFFFIIMESIKRRSEKRNNNKRYTKRQDKNEDPKNVGLRKRILVERNINQLLF